MKRTGLIVLAILIFCFPLFSCVKDEEDPQIAAIKNEITAIKNGQTTLTNNLATTNTNVTKAQKDATDANANATTALQKVGQVSAPDLSTYTKKAEVPKALLDNIDSLTSEQVATLRTKLGINSSSGSSSGSGSSTTVTNGNVTVSVYSISPQTIYGEGDYTIFLEAKNTNSVVKKIYISGVISAQSATCNIDTTNTKFTKDGVYLVNNPSASFSPASGDMCQSIICTTDPFFVGGGQTIVIPIKLTIDFKATPGSASMWTTSWNPVIIQ